MPDPQMRPYSIRVFVPSGDPDGLRLVERTNWTGVGAGFKRTGYKQAANRPEFDGTGIYVLVGTSAESALPMIYIGEGDPTASGRIQGKAKNGSPEEFQYDLVPTEVVEQ